MSGFFGIFKPQGGPIDMEVFDQMKTAMHRDGFDGMETHVEDGIAMGHLMLRVTPESIYDKQPLKSDCGRYLLVGHFRLDYRDELGDKLGLTQTELEKTPDSKLALMAYQKWKVDCVHHLEGDWAFAVYDFYLDKIFFAKDTFGYSALFYSIVEDSVLFCSYGNIFNSIKKVHFKTDLIQLQRLFTPPLGIKSGKTLRTNLSYVESSSRINIDSRLNLINEVYWNLNPEVRICYKFDEDYFSNFRSIFANAVKNKIRCITDIGIFLSSGLDSNTVSFFAAKELDLKGRKLFSYTSCPAYMESIPLEKHHRVNERFFLEKQLATLPNVMSSFPDFRNESIGKLINEDLKNDVLFPILTGNSIWINGILNLNYAASRRLILTGQMGNFTMSWHAPFMLIQKIKACEFKSLKREFDLIATDNTLKDLKKTYKLILKPISVALFKKVKFALIGRVFFLKKKSMLVHDLSNDFEWHSEKSVAKFDFNFSTSFDSRKIRMLMIQSVGQEIGINWCMKEWQYRQSAIDVTIDKRILEYSFQVPEEIFYKNGVPKYLIRNAMRGFIDPQILEKQGSFPQSYDLLPRLKNDPEFSDLLANNTELNIDGILKKIDIKKTWEKLKVSPLSIELLLEGNRFLNLISQLEILKKEKIY